MLTNNKSTPQKETVPRDLWDTLTVPQLIDQKSLLMDRWLFLREVNADYAKIFQVAINDIEALITKKNPY